MGCGIGFVKYVLFFFNLVFALFGLVILGAGIGIKLKISEITVLLDGFLDAPPILCIVIGSIIFVIAFFGCCGAVRESHCMVVTYAIFLLVIIIIQVVIGILVFVYKKDIHALISTSLKKGFEEALRGPNAMSEAFDVVQTQFQCCGLNGAFDYPVTGVPDSCCSGKGVVENVLKSCQVISAYQRGCINPLTEYLQMAGNTMGGVIIGVAVVEVVGAVFSLCLANSIRNADRRSKF